MLPYVRKEDEVDEHTYERLRYATDGIFRDVSKFLLLLLVTIPLGITRYIIAFAIGYGWLGRVAFGFHINSSILCTVMGFVYYLGSVFLAVTFQIPIVSQLIILALCLLCLYLFAPAETKQRPISEKRRKELKPHILIRGITLSLIAVILSFTRFSVFGQMFFYSVVCRTVNILPFFTYKRIKREEVGK